MMPPTPARAYWNQRHALAGDRERILALCQAVNRPSDLWPFQWTQLMSYVLELAPDLVLELGRGMGNSTCAFTEAANLLGPGRCRVISLCNSDSWDAETLPRLKKVVPASWFQGLQALRTDILAFDFRKAMAGARKVLLFWDAHGFEVAECVLGGILPLMADKPHAVIMHDMSDNRHCAASDAYGPEGMWKGENSSGPRMKLGCIDSHVAQAVSIVDFTSRNKLTLDSADHSYAVELDADKVAEMTRVMGEQLFSTSAHWFWFSLNEVAGPYHFPPFDPNVKSFEFRCEELRRECDQLRQQLQNVQQQNLDHVHQQYQERIEALSRELAVAQGRVQELSKSGWLKLGRRIGLAKKASWEKTAPQMQ